jgi:hypothetical protein
MTLCTLSNRIRVRPYDGPHGSHKMAERAIAALTANQ